MRKGQITVFVIIGLILVALIALSFGFKEQIMEQASRIEVTKGLTMSKEARDVQSDMQSCLTELAEFGLVVMGLQGGYTDLGTRVQYTDTTAKMNYIPYFGTAYLYYKGQNLVPTKEMMEKQLSDFITTGSGMCEKQYPGLEVDYGRIKASTEIKDDKIKLNLNLDVKVKKEERESGFKNVKTEVPVRLGIIQSVVDEIIDQQIRISEEELCISCITRIAAQNGMEVDIDRVGNDIFYAVTDEKSEIAEGSYMFLLANKF